MSSNIKIYHNPACGTSRNTLAILRQIGEEPDIIEYLLTPPTQDELQHLIEQAGLSVREAIRKNVAPYEQLQLDQVHWTDEQLLAYMAQEPILINRPFVVTPLGVKLCRPSELVLTLFNVPENFEFYKEDGEFITLTTLHGQD